MSHAQYGHACASVTQKQYQDPPTAAFFFEPLLLVFGRASGFSTRVVPRTEILKLVLQEVGYDLDRLHQERHRSNRTCYDRVVKKVDKAVWIGKTRRNPIFVVEVQGSWRLSPAGVAYAKKLNGKNLTAEYLDQRIKVTGGLKGTLWTLLRWAVARKLPPSAAAGLVDDHIHNCMMRLISRDSLRNKLLAGIKIPDTLLASYAVRAAYTDIRDWGTNPVTREVYGARTEREREKKVVLPPISDPRVIWNADKNPDDPPVDIAGDPRGFGGAVSLEEALDFQIYLDCIDDLIERKYPEQHDAFKSVVDLKMKGCNLPEILAEVPISPRHVNQMLAEARACIRRVQARTR